MTLVAAWIRKRKTQDQLIVAADSRLSGGISWDCCPKIFPLPRNDSVLAFCGDTSFAYPILLQLMGAVRNYEKAMSRELDITKLRRHFLRIIEGMRMPIIKDSKKMRIDSTDFKLIFAGYSWQQHEFKAWELYYDHHLKRFHHKKLSFHQKRTNGTKPFLFIGDDISEATKRLYAKLSAKSQLTSGNLDMEPLEVLIEMVEDDKCRSIGGAPQLVKIYPHANVLPVNVLWPRTKPEYVAHMGRPLLPDEGSKYGCLDLNSPSKILAPHKANDLLNKTRKSTQ